MSETKNGAEEMIQRISQLTRMLRISMEELGLNKEVERAAQAIPDTRDRLDYVAKMSEQAANRVLHSIDVSSPLLDEMLKGATQLEDAIDERMEQGDIKDESTVALVRQYLSMVKKNTKETQSEMMNITMAQDFQDLTCQVINKMNEVVKEVEHQLLQVLVDCVEEGSEGDLLNRMAKDEWDNEKTDKSLLNGPQIKPTEGDAVSDQAQVDDLLNELGF